MWGAWKFARICQRFGWSAWRAPYEARKEGISPEAEGRAGWPNEVSPQGRKSPSGIIGSSSLGGGSRRQNIATVIQTAYNMGGRMSMKREPIVVFHVSPILYARP